MPQSSSQSDSTPLLILGIDTCGRSGSVALARLAGSEVEILGETALEGRTYSATLVAAISDLLAEHRLSLAQLARIVSVSGPGSFTGVRVGLSATKGLAEGAGVPVVAVSRLEALAHKAGLNSAALDAHRHEIFLRAEGRELLAGHDDLSGFEARPARIAVCDEPASTLLAEAWPSALQTQVEPPTATDAIRLAAPRVHAREFSDLLLLDGHYLRRSDAEIFGDPALPAKRA